MSTNSLDRRLDAMLSELGPDELACAAIEAWRRVAEATLDGSPCEAERDLRKIRGATAGLTDRERDKYRELWDAADRAFMLAYAAAPGFGWAPAARHIAGEAVAGWQAAALAAEMLAVVLPAYKQTLAAYRQALAVVDRATQLLDEARFAEPHGDAGDEGATFEALGEWLDAMSPLLAPLAAVARERLATAQQLHAHVAKCLIEASPMLDKLDEDVARLGGVDPVPALWREMLEEVRRAIAAVTVQEASSEAR
jgi:hypothetical protein